MKRTLALFLATLILLPSCLAAASAEGKIKIYWLGYYTSNYMISDGTWAEQVLEDYFPNVDIVPITDVNSENKTVYVNTGEVLEATAIHQQFTTAPTQYQMLDQELLRTYPAEWLDEYYPDGMAAIREVLGDEFVDEGKYLYNGEGFIVPMASTQSYAPWIVLYRQDWLENLGLEEPTMLDEFHDMLYSFTYNDPDGNGIDDTYGWDPTRGECSASVIFGAFGIMSHMNKGGTFLLQDDGSVQYTSVSEEYKQALALLKEWYDEGIIDPECITDGRAETRSKWTNSKVGVLTDVWSWSMSSRGVQGIVGMVEAVAGEGSVAEMGPLTSSYGDGNVYMAYTNFPTITTGYYFTSSATDEQIKAFLQIQNALVADDELFLKLYYGEEGIDYTIDENGKLKVGEQVTLEYQVNKGIYSYFGSTSIPTDRLSLTLSDADIERLNLARTWKLTYSGYNFPSVSCEAYNTYFSEVRKIEDEFYSNLLLGIVTLENDWDQYLANMNQAGLGKILAGYEEALK